MLRNYVRLLLIVVVIALAIHWIYLFVQAPEWMPQKMDANGNVIGSMAKNSFFALMGFVECFTVLGLPALGLVINRMPKELINIPNRDYWLAEERFDESISVAKLILELTAIMSGIFLAILLHLSYLKAVDPNLEIGVWMWGAMGGFAIYVVSLIIFSSLRFRRPPE